MNTQVQAVSFSILDNSVRVVDGLYSLNDLHKASGNENKHRPTFFLANDQTKDLISEIEGENYDVEIPTSKNSAVKTIQGKGKNQGTYVCRELVYAYAMWISAKFHLLVIRAFDAMNNQPVQPLLSRAVISPEQKAALFAIVAKRAGDNGKIRAQLWARHNHHFRVAKYEELLAIHFDDAVAYLENMELSTPKTQALPAPSKECEQAMSLINSLQDLTVLSGTVNYEQVRDGVRHLLIHLGQHQPYAQVKPAVTVLEAAERMMCRLWTMIDESSFRASLLMSLAKSGRPLTDGNMDTLGHINSILSRKMMHVEFPVV